MEKPGMNYASRLSVTQEKKKKRRKYPNVFFKKEMTKLFEHIDHPRTMVASFLAFICALRISEVCELQWVDIDLHEKRMKVVDGKNHKDGYVPISPLAIPVLKKWREMNPQQKYFLPTDHYGRTHLEPGSLLKDYKRALLKGGMEIQTDKNAGGAQQHQYKFHTLRHSRCTHLLSNGVPLEKVQRFMRHDKIETTLTYTWIMDGELTKMVAAVDTGYDEFLPVKEQTKIELPQVDPLLIAQKRLAYGEISIREYQKITRALTIMG